MKHPKISIVTPSFNQERFLEQTIKSVVSQDYPNLEYIVIDGGSSDKSPEIISKYADKLAYWVSEPDGGHAEGLNKGFKKSTGEIMGWINSDDMLTPWSLRTIAEIFTRFTHVNWIHGTNSWWNSNGQMINASQNRKNIYDYLTGNYTWIQQESVFWRRPLWDRAGGAIATDFKFMIDGELWSRFFQFDELFTVNCILSGYRLHEDNRATLNYSQCISEMQGLIKSMETRCTPQVLRNAKALRYIQKITKSPLLNNAILAPFAIRLIKKTMGRRIFINTGYKIIYWDTERNDWTEKREPFN